MSSPKITFRPLKHEDIVLLTDWFKRPHVKEWYARGMSYTEREIKEKYLPRIENHDSIPNYIIYSDDQAIGYIQAYRLNYSLPDGVKDYKHIVFKMYNPEELVGIDIFIADEKLLGTGICERIVNRFIDGFIKDHYRAIVVDPRMENIRAIGFFKKLGFNEISNDNQHALLLLTINDMTTLKKNMINLFGDEGGIWLKSISSVVDALAYEWQLSSIHPVNNMTYNYVVMAKSPDHGDVVLKVSFDDKLIHDEVIALKYFKGHGMVELIEHNDKYHAMLLHQAIPGHSLRSIYPVDVRNVIAYYSAVVKNLASVPYQDGQRFRHIRDWLSAIDRADRSLLPANMIDHAMKLKTRLLETAKNERVLHGDLHHDNILSDGDKWLAIDPKGIIGELAFEAAAFDFIHHSETHTGINIPELFKSRVAQLSDKLSIEHDRLYDWVFVRLILGACWSVDDNDDPSDFLRIATAIFPCV